MELSGERQAQWLRGVLDLAVLAVLQRGETYGYALLQSLAEAGLEGVKGGTVYPLLNRLERDGLVVSTWRTGENGPARKYFAITDQGAAVLDAGTAGWSHFSTMIGEILSPGARRR